MGSQPQRMPPSPATSEQSPGITVAVDDSRPPVKVLFIMGWGRSGSTIMDNLLGGIDGFFSAGELSYFWERGLIEGRRCGCGVLIRDCEVWSAVLKEAVEETLEKDIVPSSVVAWQRQTARVRHTWRLVRRSEAPSDGPLRAYADTLARLYAAIARVTGARVIVDSSKRPSDAAMLRLVAGVEPYYVHLVRDPRAVAYSWQRRKTQLDKDRPADLVPHNPFDSTVKWVEWNLAAEALRRRHDPDRSILVRYEDFVAHPRSALERMAALTGETSRGLPLEGERRARLSPNHTVSGNPSRFTTGVVELRVDDEWRTRQRRLDRLVSTSLALPLLSRYGYPIRPAKAVAP